MTGSTQRLPRTARRILATALAGGLAVGLGVVADAGPATAGLASLRLVYTCRSPAGSWAVGLTVAATIPAAGAASRPIVTRRARLTVGMPPAAAGRLAHLGAASVSGAVTLGVAIAEGRHEVMAPWRMPLLSAPVRTGRGLSLSATAAVPTVTAAAPGTVTFTAARLALTLTRRAPRAHTPGAHPGPGTGTSNSPATGQAAAAAGAATPSAVLVTCAPVAHQHTRIAAVTVGKGSGTATPPPGKTRGGGLTLGPPPGTRPAAASRRRPKLPKGCGAIKKRGNGTPVCAYLTGYSDVLKLNGAALLQPARPKLPGLLNVDLYESFKRKNGDQIAKSTGELYYQGRHELPPVTATFLTFGFVPVTATLQLRELTPIKILSVAQVSAPPYRLKVTSKTTVTLRIYDKVKVNGVTLHVGNSCRTVRPLALTLIGRGQTSPPRGYNLPNGGPLTGTVVIPRFTGCGVGENLDPLFNGTISGPGNFTKMTQGKLCYPSLHTGCPPKVPRPRR